eukprot:m.40651 g.40651  ORF g.40651 m.40651 type:complete len:773 (+) comp11740_c1_seq1:579-2897(+)
MDSDSNNHNQDTPLTMLEDDHLTKKPRCATNPFDHTNDHNIVTPPHMTRRQIPDSDDEEDNESEDDTEDMEDREQPQDRTQQGESTSFCAASDENEKGAETRRKGAATANEKSTHPRPKCATSDYDIVDCPVFTPTEAEFDNPLKYIASIRPEAEKYGICVIRPPPMWKPACVLDEKSFTFPTRKERTHQLFKRRNMSTFFLDTLARHLKTEGISLEPWPSLAQVEVDLFRLYTIVEQFGGVQLITDNDGWGAVANQLGIPPFSSRSKALFSIYLKYLLSFSMLSSEQRAALEDQVRSSNTNFSDEPFGFGSGREHSLSSFKQLDMTWRKMVFGSEAVDKLPPPNVIEKKYWEIVQGDRHFNAFYGSDIDTTVFGSAFPTKPSNPFSRFGFNLNVLPGLPESMLKYLSGISGISMPWVYIGMLFSSFCWHVEDNFLYSINYMHFGEGKRWYGVPSSDAHKLEAAFRKYLPQEFENNPMLLHDLVTMMSPELLAREGVLVSTCVQMPRDYVVTFPQSYHAGFSQAYNCCEAVNFAAADWLPFGMRAMHQYRLEHRPMTLDQERLLCQVALQETDINMLRYAYPLLQQVVAKERRDIRSRLATGELPLWPLADAVQLQPEAFGVQHLDEEERTQKHSMISVEAITARMRMARGQKKAAVEEVLAAPLEDICMICCVCRRICFFSAILLKPSGTLQVQEKEGVKTRYDDDESEASNSSRLCCLDCQQLHEQHLKGHMQCLVMRFTEDDMLAILECLADKVKDAPPVPASEFYGLV